MTKKQIMIFLISSLCALSACSKGGESSGGSSSSQPENSNMYSNAPEGAVVEVDGVQTFRNGAIYMSFVEQENNTYGVELHNLDDNSLISYNEEPCILKVRGPDTGLIASYSEDFYKTGYEKINAKSYGYSCYGRVNTKNNTIFEFYDNYYLSYEKGITVDRKVSVKQVGSDKDVGFASIYSMINGADDHQVDNFEYLIPSILYKDTSNMTASAIANNLFLDRVYVKETRMGIPMAMMRSTETSNFVALSHANPKISCNGLVGGGGIGACDTRIQYGAFGFTMATVSVDFVYPCSEGPATYDCGASWARRYHQVEAGISHQYELVVNGGEVADFNHALTESVEVAYSNLNSEIVEYDNRVAYEQAIAAFLSEYREFGTGTVKCAGLPWELKLDRDLIAREYSFQMGFVGMQSSVGAHLYHEGLYSENADWEKKGKTIVDFWCSQAVNANYFPYVWWDAGNNEVGGQRRNYACYLRCMCDGMEGILDAYRYGLAFGKSNGNWLQTITTFADRLVAKQNTDGSFNRAYNTDGSVAINAADSRLQGESKLNTPIAIKFLAKMYELTRNETYKNAVLSAAEYSYTNLYQALGKYVGGTPDNPNVVDKEAAIYAMYGFTYAYKITQDNRFKEAMIHAACCCLTWTFMYDFACPSGDAATASTNPFNEEGHMIGFSVIATGHGASDNFASFIWYELYRVFELTGLEYFKDSAILLQNCCKGNTDYNGDLGYLYNCMCPEATRVSDFNFIGVKVWLPWCSIANINPILNVYREHGVWQIEDIVEE